LAFLFLVQLSLFVLLALQVGLALRLGGLRGGLRVVVRLGRRDSQNQGCEEGDNTNPGQGSGLFHGGSSLGDVAQVPYMPGSVVPARIGRGRRRDLRGTTWSRPAQLMPTLCFG
jgi:hypothetical protein